ncbi:MAG: filamentous hemagglutinin N-terminal domain-containing protein, partial [bacterium]|nr:filamentous hemagglutinin N-terminal domain-containing protein [bacterium]
MSSKNGHRTSQLSGRHFSAIAIMAAGVLCVASLQLPMAHAQVTSDGTLGTAVNLDVDIFEITGGTRPGAGPNLLHSFGSFSVGSGEAADFINDTGLPTTNILSRVTGGATSDIFGTIQTTGFPGASLFLLNPAGIVFGPGAFLDVEGSFHASTADYIKLGADGIFHADPGQPSVLTTSPPSAFGFLSANTGFIDTIGPALLVPEGATLSLVGGDLFVEDTWLIAPAGDVNLISVASAGEATFNSPINVDGFAELGPINILDGSVVDGKNIFIRGGQLVIADALVFPGGFSVFGFTPPPDGGEVNIEVTHDINISGTGPVPFLEDTPGIQTFAGFQDEIIGGDVPDIRIKAGAVTVSGEAVILALRQGPGNPPEISITTTGNTVRVENGANIGLINAFEGPGGSLTIDSGEVVLSGNGAPGFTGLSAQGQFHPLFEELSDPELTFADAGSITVNASHNVTVSDAEISATSFAFGTGGNVTINTGGDLLLSDNAAI